MLVEFASVVDAVACAVAIQRGMVGRNAGVPADKRIVFRIGINVGDIIIDGDDIFGDGVNIAARLRNAVRAGRALHLARGERSDQGQAVARLRRSGRADGEEHLARGRRVRARREGHRGAAGQPRSPAPCETAAPDAGRSAATSRRSTSARPATACSSPIRASAGAAAGQDRQLDDAPRIRFREPDLAASLSRTCRAITRSSATTRAATGCRTARSTRFRSRRSSRDLEAVVDAAGIERFALLGISQGCAVSIAYAVRHPERVTHLVLYGGYAGRLDKTRREPRPKRSRRRRWSRSMRLGWGQENPAFRQLFTSQFIPGRHQGTGRLVQRAAAHLELARRRRAQSASPTATSM